MGKRKRYLLESVLLIIVCLAVFANTLKNQFVWDDIPLITENTYIRSCKNIPLFFSPGYWNKLHPLKSRGEFRPLRTASFAADYHLWKLNPAGYHLTNLVVHAINVILIYFFILHLAATGTVRNGSQAVFSRLSGVPFLAALFFAVHPAHTESVTYIKNRSELLSFLFVFLALLFFIKSERPTPARTRGIFYLTALFCFCLAVLSKETALILPLVLILYAACFLPSARLKGIAIKTIPFVIILPVYFWFRITALSSPAVASAVNEISTWHQLLAVLKTLAWYLKILVFPLPLVAEYYFKIPESVFEPAVLLSIASLLSAAALAAAAWRKKAKGLFFALAWIFLTLLPVSNIIFLYSRPLAEQRLYLPSFGFCLLLAILIQMPRSTAGSKRPGRKQQPALTLALALLVTVVFSLITVNRNNDWRNELGFYLNTIAATPASARMRLNLGAALTEKGCFDEAIHQFQIAASLMPNMAEAYYNIGSVMEKKGLLEDAVKHYHSALALDPGYAEAFNNLGVVLAKTGHLEEAVENFSQAVRLKPDFPAAYCNIGFALATQGRLDDALKYYSIALERFPDYTEAHYKTGEVLFVMGRYEEALAHFKRVPKTNPAYAAAAGKIRECLPLIHRPKPDNR